MKTDDENNEDWAWDQIAEEHGPRLFRYFQNRGFKDDAADCVQDTLIRLIEKSDRFDSQKGPWRAFLFGIAHHIALEKSRKKKKWSFFKSLDEEDIEKHMDPADLQRLLEIQDEVARLNKALEYLSQDQKDIVYLYYDEEMTTKEISEVLRVSEGTIKSHLSRSREKLRNLLGKEMSHG